MPGYTVQSSCNHLLSLLTVPAGDQRLGVEPGGAVDPAPVLVAGQRGLAAAEGVRPAHAALVRGPGQQPLLGRVPGQAHHLRLLGPHRPYAKLVPAVARPPDPEVMKLHIQKLSGSFGSFNNLTPKFQIPSIISYCFLQLPSS